MSRIRRMVSVAITLCILVSLFPMSALAGVDRKKSPTAKLSKGDTIRPGIACDITVSCSKPGFVTARILDAEDNQIIVICEDKELPSGKSVLTWNGCDENGNQVEKGKYKIAMTMTDEWGNVSKKESTGNITVGDKRPEINNLKADLSAGKWVISGTGSIAGNIVIDLHMAIDLENKLYNVVTGYSNREMRISEPDGSFSFSWNGKMLEVDGKEKFYYDLDPGYYALRVYLDDKKSVRSLFNYIYVTVADDKRLTPYITGEEAEGVVAKLAGEEEKPVEQAAATATTSGTGTDASKTGTTATAPTAAAERTPNAVGTEGFQIGAGPSDVATQSEDNYWNLPANATDEQLWAALIKPMTTVDIDETQSASLLETPEPDGKIIGKVNGLTHAVNVISAGDTWSLVESYRIEDGAFMRGYIRNSRLRTVEVDQEYGLVLDKATQTLSVFKEGVRIGSVLVSTGLATKDNPNRETPAGEFFLATRMGKKKMAMGYILYSTRISGNYWIHEIPSTKEAGTDFSSMQGKLGQKNTWGTIVVAHESSSDGAINMQWIWDTLNKRTKILILDDKDRSVIPF